MPILSPAVDPPFTDFDFLHRAHMLAHMAHYAQFDKAGQPYMWHLLRVGYSLLPDVQAAAVGLNHDIFEDTPTRREVVIGVLGLQGCEAVEVLTHKDGEPYADYITRIANNPLATKVKIADLRDNLNPWRLAKLPDEDRLRLQTKYMAALDTLSMAAFHHAYKGEPHETHRNSAGTGAVQLPSRTNPAAYPEDFLKALAGGSGISRDPFAEANTVIAAGSYPNRTPEGKAGEPATESIPAPAAADATGS